MLGRSSTLHFRKEVPVSGPLYHLTFGAADSHEESTLAILAALAKSEGFGPPPEDHDPEDYDYHDGYEPDDESPGTYLRFDILPRKDGGDWFCLKYRAQSEIVWARQFCRLIEQPVEIYEVHGEDKVLKNSSGKDYFPIEYQNLRITPNGDTQVLKSSITDDSELTETAHGDFYQSVDFVFNALLADTIDDFFDMESMDFYRPAGANSLSPRLEGIAREVKCAKSVRFEDVQGTSFLRIEAPDGSKRLARVSDADLDALRETLGSFLLEAAS
jgi:hypothetical protein